MPSKIQLDENLWFLFICLQKSDYKTIDFNAVGQATNLKSPAARMRYTRLRRQIEGGTLIGTHGTRFSGGAEKNVPEMRKHKTDSQPPAEKNTQPTALRKSPTPDRKIKSEQDEFSDGYETDYSEDSDWKNDMPLVKRRNIEVRPGGIPFGGLSTAPTYLKVPSRLHSEQVNSCWKPPFLEARHREQDVNQIQSTMPSGLPEELTDYGYEPTSQSYLEPVVHQPVKNEIPSEIFHLAKFP